MKPAHRSVAAACALAAALSTGGQAQNDEARQQLRARAAQLQANLPAAAQPDRKLVYRTYGDGKPLSLWVYFPGHTEPTEPGPAIVLYHGGGWTTGTPVFYLAVARHFSERGMVVVLPEYRTHDSAGSTIPDSTRDARSAMRWVKAHAGELGIDLERLSAGGGSAGGHLAAALAAARVDHDDDPAIDPRPKALVLFNPAVNFSYPAFADAGLRNNPAVGDQPLSALSDADPMKNLEPGYPPCIVFQGTADEVVPFGAVAEFVAAVNAAGSACEHVPYEGRGHTFYQGPRNAADFDDAMARADAFLTELGLMPAR